MSASDWTDLLDGLYYVYAQPVLYGLAFFIALIVLAAILQFAMDTFSSRSKDD